MIEMSDSTKKAAYGCEERHSVLNVKNVKEVEPKRGK